MDTMGCECASLVIAAVRVGRLGLIIFVRTGLTPDAPVVVASPSDASPEALASAQATLDAQLVTLYTFLAVRCAVMIFKGHSDPR